MNHSKLAIGMIGGAAALVLALSPSAALAHHGHHHHGHNLLRGDLTPSMPTDDPINGVDPGGLPWIISRGEVRVRDNGRMDVRIEGLQIPRNGAADNPVANHPRRPVLQWHHGGRQRPPAVVHPRRRRQVPRPPHGPEDL